MIFRSYDLRHPARATRSSRMFGPTYICKAVRRAYRTRPPYGQAPPRGSAFAHVGGFAADEEVVPRRREEIHHPCVFKEAPFALSTSPYDHGVAWAASPLATV